MEERLKVMCCYLMRLRRLGQWFLQRDLKASIYEMDEKPLHSNEAAASRERFSLMTVVTSSAAAASSPRTFARTSFPHDVSHE